MDRTLEDTFYILFTTRAFATGVPTTLAGTPVVSAYGDAGLTQLTAGITLGVDHDGVAGLNLLTLVATAANGYAAGTDYNLVITTGTVDSVSVVGEVVGQFSLGLAASYKVVNNASYGNAQLVRSTTPANTLDVDASGDVTAGTVGDKIGYSISGTKTTLDALNDIATTAVVSAGAITTLSGAVVNVDTVDTTTTNTDMRGTDSAALASAYTSTRAGYLDNINNTALQTEVTAARMATLTDWINGGRLDLLLDAIKLKTDNLPEGIQKNAALNNFEFQMVLASDHVSPGTGLTVTAEMSIDGAAYTGMTNAVTEVSSGTYKINLAAADTNGDVITFQFTAGTADATYITFKTES